jgi:hypothetical protein
MGPASAGDGAGDRRRVAWRTHATPRRHRGGSRLARRSRRLREVYERLGVTSRTEAIMVAERLGLFDQD